MHSFRDYTKKKIFDKYKFDLAERLLRIQTDNDKINAGFATLNATLEDTIKERVAAATRHLRLGERDGMGPS